VRHGILTFGPCQLRSVESLNGSAPEVALGHRPLLRPTPKTGWTPVTHRSIASQRRQGGETALDLADVIRSGWKANLSSGSKLSYNFDRKRDGAQSFTGTIS